MKKSIIFLTPILILFIVVSCSKEHDAPTFGKYGIAQKPVNVVASYDTDTDIVNVTWNIIETTSVVDFIVSVSDSSDFDMGNVNPYITHSTDITDMSYLFEVKNYLSADVDSTILYFTVSAVYKEENLNYFIGPRADVPASALIKRD